MHRETGKASFICPLLYSLIIFAIITIAFFATGIASAAEVTLAWDANTEPDLTGYKIHYDTSPGNPYYGTEADQGPSPITVLIKDLDDPYNPKFTLTELDDNEDYYFALTAFNSENLESGYSNEVSTASGIDGGYSRGGDSSSGGGGGGCFIGTTANGLPWF